MKSERERSELLARLILLLILAGLPLALFGYQFVWRPALAGVRTIDIVAAAPEGGGFQPDTLRLAAGERVRLRFSAPDVTHGLAIGPGLGLDFGQIDPGQVKEVEVTFERPGRYTLYCNTWCSPNHWRMRSTIDVYDPADPGALPLNTTSDPVIASLAERGVDIDAPHQAEAIFVEQPSAVQGAEIVRKLGNTLPSQLARAAWRRTHTPVEGWTLLRATGLSESEAWDAVAFLWLEDTAAGRRKTAASLYAKNCAACHGESGNGDGPGAEALAAQEIASSDGPTNFSAPNLMLGGTSDIYYAKIRRGGMGTGMPSFGPLFTSDETWLLVDYLWTFVFEAGGEK